MVKMHIAMVNDALFDFICTINQKKIPSAAQLNWTVVTVTEQRTTKSDSACVRVRLPSFSAVSWLKMAVEKRLAFSVVQFLRDQIHCAALNSDEQESLEGGSAL